MKNRFTILYRLMKRAESKVKSIIQRESIKFFILLMFILIACGGVYFYCYRKIPVITFTITEYEKYTILSAEELIENVNIENADKVAFFDISEGEDKHLDTLVLDTPKKIRVIAKWGLNTVILEKEISLKDTVKPQISIMYNENPIEDGTTITVGAEVYKESDFKILSVDNRFGETIENSYTFKDDTKFPEKSVVGVYPIKIETCDDTNCSSFNFTLSVEDAAKDSVDERNEYPSKENMDGSNSASRNVREAQNAVAKSKEKSIDNKRSRKSFIHHDLAYDVFRATNRFRRNNGVEELSFDNGIASLAVDRAYYQDNIQGLSHDGVPLGYGENLYFITTSQPETVTGESIATAFYNSSGHRKNMLNSKYSHMGVGVLEIETWQPGFQTPSKTYYVVELFK